MTCSSDHSEEGEAPREHDSLVTVRCHWLVVHTGTLPLGMALWLSGLLSKNAFSVLQLCWGLEKGYLWVPMTGPHSPGSF